MIQDKKLAQAKFNGLPVQKQTTTDKDDSGLIPADGFAGSVVGGGFALSTVGTGSGAMAATGLMGSGFPAGLLIGGILGAAGAAACVGGVIGAAFGSSGGKSLSKEFQSNFEEAKGQRSRNADGRFRTKSGTTHLETLRETYGANFAAGLPGNMPLQVLRAATGMSLTQLVKNPDKVGEAAPKLESWEAPKPAPGGRSRNADGTIRSKRGDTKLETLRDTYGLDFAAGLPGNMPLAVLRAVTGKSLSQIIKNPPVPPRL